jgi:hypothetical protein
LKSPFGVHHETAAAYFRNSTCLDRIGSDMALLCRSCSIATIGRAILSVKADRIATIGHRSDITGCRGAFSEKDEEALGTEGFFISSVF